MKIIEQTKLINLLLIIGIGVLTICGALAYNQVQRLIIANTWIVHTHTVISTTNKTNTAIDNSYYRLKYAQLTNNKNLLQAIPTLNDAAKKNAHLLTELTKNNAIQNSRAKELEMYVLIEINLINHNTAEFISKSRHFNPIDTSQSIALEEVSQLINEKIDIFTLEEGRILKERNDIALKESTKSNLLFIIFGIISECIIIISFLLFNYSLRLRSLIERKQLETERQLLESNRKLKESEEQYLLAIEGSAAGLWDWEVGTDKVYYSPYFKKMLGYSEDEFPNSLQSFEKNIHPTDHNYVWEMINKHFEEHTPFQVEYRLKTKSGAYQWFQVKGQALWDKNGVVTRMSGSIIDISERKKNDQRLNIQFAVSETLAETLSLREISTQVVKIIGKELGWEYGALWMVDEADKKLKCIGTWNQPSSLINEFKEKSSKMQFAYGEGLPGDVWETGKPQWITDLYTSNKFMRSDIAKKVGLHSGIAFPIIMQKKVLGIIEFFASDKEPFDQDITNLLMAIGSQIGQLISRQTSERELRESEAYKTAILESASDSIITVDDQKNIISFNLQATKEFKFTSEELLDKNINIILPSFNLDLYEYAKKPAFEIIGLRQNKEEFPVEVKISKMEIINKLWFVIIIRNITERKKIEKIKSEFISVISHELRTPLTSIRGALGLVLGGAVGNLSKESHSLLEIANNNSERLLLLINDILDIEKLEAGMMSFHLQVIDIDKLIDDTVISNKLFADKYNIGLKYIKNKNESQLNVNVDPDRLFQVLTNLISNAIKFSSANEEVIITTERYQDKIRILVSNKGVGIPLEFQKTIFTRFSQADTSDTRGKGGTGLGLNISKVIIEKLGGSIGFYSKPNDTTTFYFDLPLFKTAQTIIAEINNSSSPQNRILICEDDYDQAIYLGKLLESKGFIVDISGTVKKAKQLLANNNYYVLLLDLILPDHDGISFIRELRNAKETHNLPIIVISSFAQTGRTLLNEADFSVTAWLDKPLDFNKLVHALNEIKHNDLQDLPKILYIEDDSEYLESLKEALVNKANVIAAVSLQEAIAQLKKDTFNLIIMDLILPDGNMEDLLPFISAYKYPIIVYSDTNLDDKYKKIVTHALLKQNTSHSELINLINYEIKPRK